MSKWYVGKGPDEIVSYLKEKAAIVVKTWNDGKEDMSDKLEKEFINDFKGAISAIVDIKTAYWAYNKRVWEMWDKCHSELWEIRNKMDASFTEI